MSPDPLTYRRYDPVWWTIFAGCANWIIAGIVWAMGAYLIPPALNIFAGFVGIGTGVWILRRRKQP